MYCGAMQMAGIRISRTEVVSRGPSSASARGARTRPATPANERVLRKRRRVCVIGIGIFPSLQRLPPQLAFQLAQKAPVRAVGDDLLRARLYEAHIAHAQGIEPQRILGVVLSPFVIWK